MKHVLPDGEIYVGHVLDSLASMPAESVQMAVTSPPYFGLRAYSGEQRTVWGGDKNCEHKWETESFLAQGASLAVWNVGGKSLPTGDERRGKKAEQTRQWCQRCGAWFGAYGLEPHPQLWAEHTLEWLRAVRRVLRRDGVVWLNVGSSYAAGGRGDSPTAKQGSNVGSQQLGPAKAPPGYKPLDLIDPFANLYAGLLADGWFIRSVVIWSKLNPMPESLAGWRFEKHRVRRKDLPKVRAAKAIDGVLSGKRREGAGLQMQAVQESSLQSLEEDATWEAPASYQRTEVGEDERGIQALPQDGSIQTAVLQVSPKVSTEREGSIESLQVEADAHRESTISSGERETQSFDSYYREPANGTGVAGDQRESQVQVLLLQGEEDADTGSRDSSEQGGPAHQGEHRSGVSSVQYQQAQQDSDALVECPGCERCSPTDGLVLRRGSWRPTSSYEVVIMLAKSASYYSDGEGVKEKAINEGLLVKASGNGAKNFKSINKTAVGFTQHDTLVSGRNLRDVWEAPEPVMRLRKDLSDADRAYVLGELLKRGL